MALFSATSAPFSLQGLIIPFVCLLIAFLGYGSQILFALSPDLEPGPLTKNQKRIFNVLLICLWWTYYKACTVDPGRYTFPHATTATNSNVDDDETVEKLKRRKRWCRKCARYKPPRAHHCKVCRRCIPRMDHHCPWTGNCVSLQTFPHFLRFLGYTNVSLWTLQYFLWQRFRMLWTNRHLPAYLGPTLAQLVWLTIFFIVGGIVALALGILGISTFKSWVLNMTMIESWEVERHEAVLERRDGYGRDEGGFWKAQGNGENNDDDALLAMEALEFPYDIGFFANMAQGMGTSNVLLWILPFASEPRVASNKDGKMKGTGWEYEENGMNDREDMWPPVDPEKVRGTRVWNQRRRELEIERDDYEARERWMSPEQDREAFRRRQERDLRRWERNKREILSELEEVDDYDEYASPIQEEAEANNDLQAQELRNNGIMNRPFYRPRTGVYRERTPWVNADGEHLGDYGVDEDAESDEVVEEKVIDPDQGLDDEVPLAEFVRRRKVLTKDGEFT